MAQALDALKDWILVREPEVDAAVRPLPCEQEVSCGKRTPILGLGVFDLAVRAKDGTAVPRYALHDPFNAGGNCEYWPEWGRLDTGTVRFSTGLKRRWGGWTMLAEFTPPAALIFSCTGTVVSLVNHFKPEPDMGAMGGGLILIALGYLAVWLACRRLPLFYVSRFSGPVPAGIRKLAREVARDGPLVLAEADWRPAKRNEARRVMDPYLVVPCSGGPFHFHVLARWEVTKGEALVEEFTEPAKTDRPSEVSAS